MLQALPTTPSPWTSAALLRHYKTCRAATITTPRSPPAQGTTGKTQEACQLGQAASREEWYGRTNPRGLEPDGSGVSRPSECRPATFHQYLNMAIRDVEDADAATDPTSLDPQVRISPDRESIRSLLVASSVPAAPAGDSDTESVALEGDPLKRSARTVNATSVCAPVNLAWSTWPRLHRQ